MSLFLCISTLDDIVHTALCKVLCLLLCKKLEIPSNAKPTKTEIIVLKFLCYFFYLQEILVKSNLLHSLICGEHLLCALIYIL